MAPFKAQNMSNNSYVTIEGGEIGRAQVAQAEAAGALPTVYMNPILLKPSANQGTQVIIQGKAIGTMNAEHYYRLRPRLKNVIKQSYHRLAEDYDVIVLEGAGSCCEMNLKRRDLVNLPLAKMLNVPCILVSDIDRGGVFAQVIGSYSLMTPKERKLLVGCLINKFRGDPGLFLSGIDYIERKVSRPVLGLIPFFRDIRVDSEDSVAVQADRRAFRAIGPETINIGVLRLPAISNFTDIEIFDLERDVVVNYFSHAEALSDAYDCLILPGTKNAVEDAIWLSRSGWKQAIHRFARTGKSIFGICGGYQILGQIIKDPLGVESDRTEVKGLRLLPVHTILEKDKIVRKVTGRCLINGKPVRGYEIHMGKSTIINRIGEPFLRLQTQDEKTSWEDGWSVNRGQIVGTYVHGIFDLPGFKGAFLNRLREAKGLSPKKPKPGRLSRFTQYDRLADHYEKYCDVEKIIQEIIQEKGNVSKPPENRLYSDYRRG